MIFHLTIEVDDEFVKRQPYLRTEVLKDRAEGLILIDCGGDEDAEIPFTLASIVDEHGSEWW